MSNTTYYFSGKSKWAKLFEPDRKYNKFGLNVYLDKESLKRYRDSGLQMQIKKDEDGQFVNFSRPVRKLIKDEVVEFGPPKVLDKDNHAINTAIGNGSDVSVKVIVYDSLKGKGHRLEAVRIENLVPYGEEKVVGSEDIVPF